MRSRGSFAALRALSPVFQGHVYLRSHKPLFLFTITFHPCSFLLLHPNSGCSFYHAYYRSFSCFAYPNCPIMSFGAFLVGLVDAFFEPVENGSFHKFLLMSIILPALNTWCANRYLQGQTKMQNGAKGTYKNKYFLGWKNHKTQARK